MNTENVHTMGWTCRPFASIAAAEGIVRYQILDERGDVVGVVSRTRLDEPAEANAAFIVRAVNSHSALLRVADGLVHFEKRLRLRNPATPAEIKAWAELREAAVQAVFQVKQGETK